MNIFCHINAKGFKKVHLQTINATHISGHAILILLAVALR